jgi:hypothetical protein
MTVQLQESDSGNPQNTGTTAGNYSGHRKKQEQLQEMT